MKQIPTTTLVILLTGLFLASQTGCRSRCQQAPCCNGGFLAANTTIAPASTYSLNIPSVAQNRPYYAPNGGPLSTTARAPIPATGTQPAASGSNSNLQWRPQGGTPTNSGSNFGAQPTQSGSGTRLVEVNNGSNINTGTSVLVGGQPLPASGSSSIDSRNFATTQTDERLDPTRVAVTDATQVRATAQTFISNGQQALAQRQPSQTFAAQPVIQQAQPIYSTNGLIASQPYYNNNPNLVQRQAIYSGQTFVQPNNSASYSASVNNDVGWRGREIGSQR